MSDVTSRTAEMDAFNRAQRDKGRRAMWWLKVAIFGGAAGWNLLWLLTAAAQGWSGGNIALAGGCLAATSFCLGAAVLGGD